MSERMTDCTAPGISGVAAYGRETRAQMIARFREHYQHQLDEAQRALAVPDEDLRVTTFLGPWAMRDRKDVAE